MKTALTFDDIQLIPNYSEIHTRQSVSLRTSVSKNYSLEVPLIAAPMDTVCGSEMAIVMMGIGGVGCLHRFCSVSQQVEMVLKVKTYKQKHLYYEPIMAAIGATGDYYERAIHLVNAGVDILVIDVAHGHHLNVKEALQKLKSNLPSHVNIIAGNVATKQGALDLEAWGADGLRVGIGGGSLCTTRIQTGFGVPNITAIEEMAGVVNIPLMIDGGIRSSGDIAKALAVGADCAMVGSLLSGTTQTPNDLVEINGKQYKSYRGLASLDTKLIHNQQTRNVEGESTLVLYKGCAEDVLQELIEGLQSALSYGGSFTIGQFQSTVKYNVVTSAGLKEARPHLIQ